VADGNFINPNNFRLGGPEKSPLGNPQLKIRSSGPKEEPMGFFSVLGGVKAAFDLGSGIVKAVKGGGGGQTQRTGFELPFESEVDLFEALRGQESEIRLDLERIETASKSFDASLEAMNAFIDGQIPSQELINRLSSDATQIASLFGGSAAEAARQGFLDADIAKTAGLIEDREGKLQDTLTSVEGREF